jgi:hypothetical protein
LPSSILRLQCTAEHLAASAIHSGHSCKVWMKFTTIFYQKNRARIQCPFSKTIHYCIFSLSSPHKAGSTKYNCVDTFRAHIHFFAIQTWAQDHTQICLCIVNIRQLFDRLQPSTRTNPVNRGRSSFSCASSSSPQEKIHHHIES